MKYIQKNEEPPEFLAWKAQEASSIAPDNKTADAIWDYFPSKCPDPTEQEPGIAYYSKTELKEAILQEQGFLCCYCNQYIQNDHNTILEHLEDKGTNMTLTLAYSNIAASCNGGQKEPKPRDLHCDAQKGGKSIPLKPTDKACELQLYFQSDGHIKGTTINAQNTIANLNLDINKLVRNRKSAIDGFIYTDETQTELINTDHAKELVDKMERRDASNRFVEFCAAIKSVLQRDFLPKSD